MIQAYRHEPVQPVRETSMERALGPVHLIMYAPADGDAVWRHRYRNQVLEERAQLSWEQARSMAGDLIRSF